MCEATQHLQSQQHQPIPKALLTDSARSLSQSLPDREQQKPTAILAALGMDQIHAGPAVECIVSVQELQLPVPVLFLDASFH